MKNSIPDMTAYAEEIEGSTITGHRRRFFASGTGARFDRGGSGSITIRKVRLLPAVAALPVPSIARAHFAIGPWQQLAPYERTQFVRTDLPSLMRRAPTFDAKWLAIYLLSTVIVALVSAITICSL